MLTVDNLLPLGGQISKDCPIFKRVPCYEECQHVFTTMTEYYNFDAYAGKIFHLTLTESFLELQEEFLKDICEFSFERCFLGQITFFPCIQCGCFCEASDVQEGTITQEQNFTERTDWNKVFTFDKYDGLGLASAIMTIDFSTETSVGYENENTINQGTFNYEQTTNYTTSGITNQGNSYPIAFIENPPAYDGITDFSGNSGDTLLFNNIDNVVVNLPLNLVEGTGTYDLIFDVNTMVTIIASSGMVSNVDTFATANVKVEYNYLYDNCSETIPCFANTYKIIDKCNCRTKIIDFNNESQDIQDLYDNTVAALLQYGTQLTANVYGVEFMASLIFESEAKVIKYENNIMYLSVNRGLTIDEISVLNFFKKALPIPFGSTLNFVEII